MTENQAQLFLAQMLLEIAKTEADFVPKGTPSSYVYVSLQEKGVTYDEYLRLQAVLIQAQFATMSNNLLHLTPTGKSAVAQIAAALEEETA